MPTAQKRGESLLTEGLIIREFNGVGEADRFITALTRQKGVIRAAVRGARRIKSRSGPATGLLMFSRLRLIPGRDMYIVEDAQPIETFFGLREDIEKTALAQYFCELSNALCPADEESEEALLLLLLALRHLEKGTRPLPLIKAVVEWRLLATAGYMADVTGCAACGNPDGDRVFLPTDGLFYCPAHAPQSGVAVSAGALTAIRHSITCPADKCFGFSLSDSSLSAFGDAAERFMKAQLGRSFKTLDFYHEVNHFGSSDQGAGT